jgi:hypothetical protein
MCGDVITELFIIWNCDKTLANCSWSHCHHGSSGTYELLIALVTSKGYSVVNKWWRGQETESGCWTNARMYVRKCVCVCVWVCECMYVQKEKHLHTHTHTHTHSLSLSLSLSLYMQHLRSKKVSIKLCLWGPLCIIQAAHCELCFSCMMPGIAWECCVLICCYLYSFSTKLYCKMEMIRVCT